MNTKLLIALALLTVSLFSYTESVICRDGSTCPGIGSCCQVPLPPFFDPIGRPIPRYGVACCPYPNAACGPVHCCPAGYIPVGNGGCTPAYAKVVPYYRPSPRFGFYGRILPFL